jgi:hypothetical protein
MSIGVAQADIYLRTRFYSDLLPDILTLIMANLGSIPKRLTGKLTLPCSKQQAKWESRKVVHGIILLVYYENIDSPFTCRSTAPLNCIVS